MLITFLETTEIHRFALGRKGVVYLFAGDGVQEAKEATHAESLPTSATVVALLEELLDPKTKKDE